MEPRFEPLASTSGLAIIDPIESRRFSLMTPEVVSQSPADPEDFHFPVSSACSIRTSEIELPYTVLVYVRETDGTMVTDAEPPVNISLPKDEYLVELASPVKIYLRVKSEMKIEGDTDALEISFGGETTVTVGARSRHKSPSGTITVSDDPEQMMQAISVLSSSLKTTSPERSFPTLRGHPPRIERGNELHIPDEFSRPETGVSIEIPPEYEKLYPVAPLAFYLGAELVPGGTPKLTTDTGFEYHLNSNRGFETEVECVLKQTFLLDCVVRTEGYYPIELAEREAIEPCLNFEFATLYDKPLAERVERYLDVPYKTIENTVPTWPRVTFVRPVVDNVELLPHIINDFSLIRTPPKEEIQLNDQTSDLWGEIDEFQRGSSLKASTFFRGTSEIDRANFTRTGRSQSNTILDRDYVSMPDTDAIEQAWAGHGIPTNGTKLLSAAYDHGQTLPDDGTIDITVVCNDSRMRREWDTVSKIYGNRNEVSIETTIEFGVGKARLRNLFREPTDLFHYIGHVDDRGFDCLDGFLDAKMLDDIGTKAFLLNACDSFNQGEALIDAGANAGIVSLTEVGNRGAVEIGEMLAKLFHQGFSVGTSLTIAREHTNIGSRYVGLGDVGLTLAQCEDGAGILYEIVEQNGEFYTILIHGYPNRDLAFGSIFIPYILDSNRHFIPSGQFIKAEVSKEDLKEMLTEYMVPMVIDGQLTWSNEWQ